MFGWRKRKPSKPKNAKWFLANGRVMLRAKNHREAVKHFDSGKAVLMVG